MSFVGEAFVAEWATFVGRASDWEGFHCWPRSLVGVGNIGWWGLGHVGAEVTAWVSPSFFLALLAPNLLLLVLAGAA